MTATTDHPAEAGQEVVAIVRSSRRTLKVLGLSAVLWLVSAGMVAFLAGPQHWTARSAWSWWIALPILALLFAATEIFVVHLQIRGDAHTFSLAELPLALGLFFASPLILLSAQVLGGGTALLLHRKQGPLKLLFNTAVFAASGATAIAIYRSLAGTGAVPDTFVVLSGAVAVLAAAVVSLSLVFVVISVSSGTWQLSELRSEMAFGMVTAGFNTSLGVIAALVIAAQPWLCWILIVPTAGIYFANWAYSTQRRRHEGLEFLYQATKLLHQSPQLEPALVDLLRHTQDTFHAETAELVYLPEDGQEPTCFRVGFDGHLQAPPDAHANQLLVEMLSTLERATVLATDPDGAAAFLTERGYHDAIIAPMFGETRTLGALVIANPLNNIVAFDTTDIRLAETLANHTAIALEKGRLEQSLEQLRVVEGHLTFQASHDALTGLANRTLFRTRLAATLEEHRGQAGAVLFIDLDGFKAVNDTLGHAAGDELLLEVAARLKHCASPSDTIARLGGDEFAILIPTAHHLENATRLAEEILTTFSANTTIANQQLNIRGSIGIAMAEPTTDTETLMRNADAAMYSAKAQGKNRYQIFNPSMQRHRSEPGFSTGGQEGVEDRPDVVECRSL